MGRVRAGARAAPHRLSLGPSFRGLRAARRGAGLALADRTGPARLAPPPALAPFFRYNFVAHGGEPAFVRRRRPMELSCEPPFSSPFCLPEAAFLLSPPIRPKGLLSPS